MFEMVIVSTPVQTIAEEFVARARQELRMKTRGTGEAQQIGRRAASSRVAKE
ncbi:MAG TPA: hypothetical protein VJN90_06455 [Candidatus Acidoferrales bacterium]|nr:hypothetical protein [Candidatus Acidoferrales bacterium]